MAEAEVAAALPQDQCLGATVATAKLPCPPPILRPPRLWMEDMKAEVGGIIGDRLSVQNALELGQFGELFNNEVLLRACAISSPTSPPSRLVTTRQRSLRSWSPESFKGRSSSGQARMRTK